ncbi:MAG: tRNA (N(6)-L-threonylcarbamoyladenosine(37)-C(2))-methylthiotransferase MtaB [Candidatus Humimicrobiaceae bacterium]
MTQNLELKNDGNIDTKSIRFAVATFGCKTNQSESDKMIMELLSYGFNLVEYNESPDFMVINTCTVTSISDKKARQFIRKIKLLNPSAKIIITGCFVDLNNKFLKENEILYIFPNNKKEEIAGFIKTESGFKGLTVKNDKKQEFAGKHTRQFIKIQDGCEQKCSYCIVPFVRNKYKSESPLSIISDVAHACSNGIEEIVITGIHIGKYGIDFKESSNNAIDDTLFSELDLNILCRFLITKTDIKRIRLSSIEINEITDELLNLIGTSNVIAEHLHIPLQSGSSRILEKMGRPYDMNYFFEKINKIKKMIPDIALTTDIIVGFPGETESDFDETLEAVKKVNFSRIHVFKYSQRKLTPAAIMDNQVTEELKNERSLRLRKIALELRDQFITLNIGKTLQTAVERIDYIKNFANGMSQNYIKVYFPSNKENKRIKIGRIVNVKANLSYLDGLKGEVV